LHLSDQEFKFISELMHDKFGINLSEQKRSLVVERLQKVLLSGDFKNFQDYYDYVINEPSGQALLDMVDRISTNYTYFFREKDHFDFLVSTALPQLIARTKGQNRPGLKIWCAGCSSGEEPYTLAMILSEFLGAEISRMDVGILATDISETALQKAQNGIYTDAQLSQVPISYRQKYFATVDDNSWAVKPNLKKLVLLRRLNLMRPEFPFKGKFDIIFCRNVIIYFDLPTQQGLIERFHRYLQPGGYLFTGHSESIDRSRALYKYIKPAVYQK